MIRDKSRVKIGGTLRKTNKRKKLNQKKKSLKKKLKGGFMPSEFYGKGSDRYFSSGSKELKPENSAYGTTNAVSFGTMSSDMTEAGPNLGPYPNSSGQMTGGSCGCNKMKGGGCGCNKMKGGKYKRKRNSKRKKCNGKKKKRNSKRAKKY
jgi:hypothetical protein